jgi:hypothetical protein
VDRLAGFEEDADPVESPATFSLPPRRRSAARPQAVAATPSGLAPASDLSPAAAPVTRTRRPVSRQPDPVVPVAGRPATVADEGTVGLESRIRPSNVHIPVGLLQPITEKKTAAGLSNGEIIIQAIEATYEQLGELIHPAATSGGTLFASRRARSSRATDGPLTPLNYRLREADFATIDELVDRFAASSRGHLITAALTAYFAPPPT